MAGTIESLDFEVILKDDKFKKSIDNDLKLARELNTKLTDILNLKKRLNNETTTQLVNAEKVRQAEAKTAREIAKTALEQQKVATEVERTRILQEKHTGAAKKTTAEYVNMKSALRTLSQLTGVAFSVVGIRRFLESMIDITGQFEVQRMALRNMLQDVDGADKIFEDLYRFSSDSTYRFSELAKYAKQLSAFNIDKGSLLETTKMLGDVASGVGVSMDRLILAYGHVKSSGFLRGIQLRSFSQNGVPILDELAKMFTETEKRAVSLGEVFDRMTKREIPFEMVEEAFRRMTSEGGKFYQMQEVLAKTLAGQINILKGRWENMLAAVGQANSGPIKDVVSTVSNLIANYELLGRKIVELIAVYGAYKTAIFLMTLASEGLFAATFNLRVGLEKLEGVLLRNPYALIAAAVTSVGYAIYQYNTALSDSEKITKAANDGISKYWASLAAEEAELDRLYAKLKYATEGTKDYDKAKLAIQNRFGPYLKQLQDEGVAVDNLAAVYQKLKDKITEAQQAKFLESESDSVEKAFASATDNIYASFKKTMDAFKISIDEQEAIWHYITSGEYLGNDRNKLSWGAGTIGVPGTWTYKDYGRSAESLRKDFEAAAAAYDAGMSSLEKVLKVRDERIKEASDGSAADTLVYNISSIVEGIKKYDKDIKEIRDKAKSGSITADEKTTLASLVASRKEQADLYKEIMGVDYDKDTRRSERASEKAEKDEINRLKTQIALLEKYLSIYEKIEPIKGEKTASWLAETIGGKPGDYKNLEAQILALTGELRKLGDAGTEAADAIEARLGLDAASQLVKQFKADQKATEDAEKALNKYLDALQKWADKTKDLSGTGAAYGISKAIADYRTTIAQGDTKLRNMTVLGTNAYKDEPAKQAGEIGSLMNLWAKDRIAALATLRQNVAKYADDIFKEQMQGYDLTNWNDKTLSQIQDIKRAISEVELPDDIKAMLNNPEFRDILTMLESLLKKQKDDTQNNTVDPAEQEKRLKYFSKYSQMTASYLSKAAAHMKEIAEATNDANLAGFAEAAGAFAETLSAAAQGAQTGGIWGALAATALSVIDQITNALAEFEQKVSESKKAVEELRIEILQTKFAKQLEDGVNTIFGEDLIRRMRNANEAMAGLNDKMADLRDNFAKVKQEWISSHVRATSGGGGQSAGIEAAYKYYQEALQGYEDLLFAWTPEGNWASTPMYSLRQIAEKLGMDLYDEFDHINADLLRSVMKILGIEGGYLEELALYAEEYKKAVEEMEKVTESLFNSLSSDLTSKFIENFKSMGNAVDDLGETFENLGETILESLLNSYILDNILDKYKTEATNALAQYSSGGMTPEEYAEWLASFTSRVQEDAERNADAINSMIAAFADRGLLGMDSDSSDANSLGNGIKGITEETASLLASYLNAIRADVSVMRALQEKGWENIAALAGVITPTLADYVQQIAANTANAAQDTNAILAELRSVIGPAGTTGDVLRVEMA